MSTEDPKKAAEVFRDEHKPESGDHHAPGTFALAIIFLLTFALYYFANWTALADVWQLR
jgi:hypothetical protein